MRNRLILNIEKKTFVLIGVFYGYVKEQTVYMFSANESTEFKIKELKIFNNELDPYSKVYVRFFNIDTVDKSTDCDEVGLFTYEENGFLPDVVFPSSYIRSKLYKFIKSYEKENQDRSEKENFSLSR
jgi:hypothetical protein